MAKIKRKPIPLFDLKLSPRVKKEVADTLASGWLTTGPKVKEFEKAVARLLKVPYTAAVNSGTVGLHLLLASVGIGPGREVITSPFTFVATVEAILQTGATPVFADIDPNTLNIDPDETGRKVGNITAAIMPVDIAGYPANYPALNKICDERSLVLIADAAHSIGATYKNQSIPKLCDAAVYSFYSTKNLTCGEGGMVVSRHKVVIDQVRLVARHGLTSSTYDRRKGNKWEYDATALGYKGNMSELHASVGLGQLELFEKNQKERIALAKRYITGLADLANYVELPVEERHYQHGWHLFIIKLHLSQLKIDRDTFIRRLARQGIECGVHYKPIFEFSWYRQHLGLSPQHFPNAVYAGRRVVSLPFYPGLKKSDVDYICECITSLIRKNRQ